MPDLIDRHFAGMNLDLRKKYSGYSRYMDQKVTPDVLSFIADCILNLADREIFSVRDVWSLRYFEKNTVAVFAKPPPSEQTASAEYGKFIGQPIKALAYAGVLAETRPSGNRYRYSIVNEQLLGHISWNERGALGFLQKYIEKVLSDSGFIGRYNKYKEQMSKQPEPRYFHSLKSSFDRFMLGNTKIKQVVEIHRIFPKVVNPLAVRDGLPGAERGKVSEGPFMYSGLMYNRINFRDRRSGKPKGITRQGHDLQNAMEMGEQVRLRAEYRLYSVRKTVKKVRELASSASSGQGERSAATHAHHIFARAQHPQFEAYPENLIMLTPDQHLSEAHPNSRTSQVDSDYQIQYLLAQCDSIAASLRKGETLYSKKRLVKMLNDGLALKVMLRDSFAKIKEKLRTRQTRP